MGQITTIHVLKRPDGLTHGRSVESKGSGAAPSAGQDSEQDTLLQTPNTNLESQIAGGLPPNQDDHPIDINDSPARAADDVKHPRGENKGGTIAYDHTAHQQALEQLDRAPHVRIPRQIPEGIPAQMPVNMPAAPRTWSQFARHVVEVARDNEHVVYRTAMYGLAGGVFAGPPGLAFGMSVGAALGVGHQAMDVSAVRPNFLGFMCGVASVIGAGSSKSSVADSWPIGASIFFCAIGLDGLNLLCKSRT